MNQITISPTILDQQPDLTGYHAQARTSLKTLDGKFLSIAELEAYIAQTMEQADVAGLSCAIINEGKSRTNKLLGMSNKTDGSRNDEQTIFSAASFSKTVFAYLVMLLVEEKALDLDTPLEKYLPKPLYEYPDYADLKGDDRYKQITVRTGAQSHHWFSQPTFHHARWQVKHPVPPARGTATQGRVLICCRWYSRK